MGILGMSNNNPPPRTKDFFASPALSLSLAGIFRDAGAAASSVAGSGGGGSRKKVEEGEEGSRRLREETVEISSENSGATRSRSYDEFDPDGEPDNDQDGDKKKKQKKYHRHTIEQIREMEALFKESPHPNEKQRQQLSKQLGLAPRQVKFWFQNRRTQLKAIQERHEYFLLKTEMEKLRDENKAMRETIQMSCCPSCGSATASKESDSGTQEQQLRIENVLLNVEVEKLRVALGKYPPGTTKHRVSAGGDQETRSSLDFHAGIFGLDKLRIMELVNQGLEELKKMATAGEPLWIRSVQTGREILNYDEYVKEFKVEGRSSIDGRPKRSIEASRETGVVFVDLPQLIQSLMNANQWKEMFPCLITKAATINVINSGEGLNRNGAVQLMFAELQMLTPLVSTREVYFIRFCKQLSPEQWAIVDVSIDRAEDNIDASLVKCRKHPSGCIIEDKTNGHCNLIWVEHLECQMNTVHPMYRTIVSSGLAFGARHWMATLQLQCEKLAFFMATNVPTKDSNGIATLAGRKSILRLAQRMNQSFCHAVGASSFHSWTKVSGKTGEDIRVASRKNFNEPVEPLGAILCAVASVQLPVSPDVLFDFLRDGARRHEWDIMSNGVPAQSIANVSKGQVQGNSVNIQTMKSKDDNMWLLQDTCTNAYESMVVYTPVDIPGIQAVMTGCDSSNIAVLPSGFSILPDSSECTPLVITSRQEEKISECGSLLTIALQILTNASPTGKLTVESVESANTLISCMLRNIRTSLQCEE